MEPVYGAFGFGCSYHRALHSAGIQTLVDLKQLCYRDLGMIPKIGRDSVRSILHALADEPAMTRDALKIQKLQQCIFKHKHAIAEAEAEAGIVRLHSLVVQNVGGQYMSAINTGLKHPQHDR